MTQNGNINPLFHLGGNFYGHIRIQHYQYYQKLCITKKKSEICGYAGRATVCPAAEGEMGEASHRAYDG